MKTATQLTIIYFTLSIIFLASCGKRGEKQDDTSTTSVAETVEVSPQVIFENDFTKVVKVSLSPGEVLASHEGNERIIYSLSDYSIKWVEKGKDEGSKSWIEGDVHFHESGQHSAHNNSTTVAEWIAFSKKDMKLPECGENTLENDVNSVAPEFANLLFENDMFRVTRVTLPQGETIPMHSGINRIIYSLVDYQIMYESNKDGKGEKEFQKGDVHWHEACEHALENIGETDARFLVVSFK